MNNRVNNTMLAGPGWPAAVDDWLGRDDRSPLLVVDSHTAGNPTRILLAGLARPGHISNVAQTRLWLRDEADWVRTRLVHEPRGGGLTCAVVPVLGADEEGDIGAVILEPGSYPPMCGHCMIGFSAVIAELELLPDAGSKEADFTIMTPAGVVEAHVECAQDGKRSVTLTNVESYVISTVECSLESGRTIRVALLFGGDYYLTVDADELGLQLDKEEAPAIVQLAAELRKSIAGQPIRDPATGGKLDVYQVMLFRRVGQDRARVVVVAPPGVIDRSPCGTGSSALLALLVANGEIGPTDTLTTESIIGSEFELRATDDAISERGGVRPTLSGSAHINGFLTIVADRHDALRDGFPPL